MWNANSQIIDAGTVKTMLREGSREMSVGEVLEAWRNHVAFRVFFTEAITSCAFEAFFWEMPPVTEKTLDRKFEFVLIESATLSRVQPDAAPFAAHFTERSAEEVLAFPNLGGDAVLVVPAPRADETCYTHLARFLRQAPRTQVDGFWRTAGEAMQQRISNSPTWLSTAGLGVSWLHLRLDSRPKYYRHEPYRRADYFSP